MADLNNVLKEVQIVYGEGVPAETKVIGPDAENVVVYKDENDKVIRTNPTGEYTMEGASTTLSKLEKQHDELYNKISEVNKELATYIEEQDVVTQQGGYKIGDYIIYGLLPSGETERVLTFAEVIKNIDYQDRIVSTGSNANVKNLSIGQVLTTMKNSFQAGVDAVYNACYNTGLVSKSLENSTPGDRTPDNIATAITTNLDGTTAQANNILAGQTAYSEQGKKMTGTMTNKGAVTLNTTASSGNVVLSKDPGYYTQITANQTPAYNKGVTDADARVNINSASYKKGREQGHADKSSHTLELAVSNWGGTLTATVAIDGQFLQTNSSLVRTIYSSFNGITL